MTATSEHTHDLSSDVEPQEKGRGLRILVRSTLRIVGVVLVLSALGFWFAPGASWESDLILFKLLLSVTSGVVGLGMLQSSMGPRSPSVEIDPARAEIRVLRSALPSDFGRPATYSFSELSHAKLDGTHVSFWGKSDRLLAEVTMSNRRALASVIGALQDAGKLA